MNDSNSVTDPESLETTRDEGTYVSTDGILKYCITAPLLELPIDFQAWPKPNSSDTPPLYRLN
jgi:hypothetical protein